MINVTTQTKNAFLANSVGKHLVVSFPDISLTFTDDDIVSESMALTQIIEKSGLLTFKGCNASKFELSLLDFEQDVRGERVTVSIQAGNTEYITIFDGIVDEQNNQNHEDATVKIVAYDKLYTVGEIDVTAWYAGLTFPMTVKQFRDSFFNHIGLAQETVSLPCDNLTMSRMTSADVQLTAKYVMQSICQTNARFGLLREGIFSYIKLSTNVTTELSENQFINVDYDPYLMEPITKVSVLDDSGVTEETYGSGNNVLKIEGNMVAYAVDRALCAELIYDEVSGLTMNSARLNLIGLPFMECGDYVELSTAKNDIGMFILSRTLKGIQGLYDSYDSTVEQYMHEVGSLARELIRQNGRINHFYRDLEETKSTVANNKIDADGKFEQQQTQITQNASSISAEITRAQGAESNLNSRITQTADSLTVQIEAIYAELDGEIEVFYREGEPTLLNYPAWDFTYNIPCNNTVQTTNDLKFIYNDEYYQSNIRDLVYDTDTNQTYRFEKENGVYFWRPIAQTDFGVVMEKVSELEVTTEQIQATVSATVTELHDDYYTKNETESKLTLTANSVLSVVSQTYTNSTDLAANYTKKSTFEQTVDSITTTVQAKVDNTTFETTIQQTESKINLKVSKGNISSEISQEAGAISIRANRLTIDSTYFKLAANGNITATGGTIGGFTIGATALYNGKSSLASTSAGVYVGTDGIGVGFGNGFGFKVDRNGTCEILPLSNKALVIGQYFSVSSLGALTIGSGNNFTVNSNGNQVKIGGGLIFDTSGSPKFMKVPLDFVIKDSTTYSPTRIRFGNTLDVGYSGDTTLGNSSSKIGFFGGIGTTKQAVNQLPTSASLATVISRVNSLLATLRNYGLITSS